MLCRPAKAPAATGVAGTTVDVAVWPLFAWLPWTEPAILVAGTIIEGASLASVRSVAQTASVLAGSPVEKAALAPVLSV